MLTIFMLPFFLLPTASAAAEACPQPQSHLEEAQPANSTLTDNRGTTRLRKLHLVRPELIPYPLAYDVYC